MYCIKCGVELSNTEKQCPLCQTRVFHPDIRQEQADDLYPKHKYPATAARSCLPQVLITAVFLLPLFIVLLCDLQFSHGITWSGYVTGALLVAYVSFILPTWFRNPNPVIFVPCSFAAAGVYLLYINLATDGNWFVSFALPVVGVIGSIVTAVVTLLRYVRRGKLYILGGAAIALGAFMLLMEFLLNITFGIEAFIGWSLYPLVTLALLGGTLIFLGICRPARETMERKFFI